MVPIIGEKQTFNQLYLLKKNPNQSRSAPKNAPPPENVVNTLEGKL